MTELSTELGFQGSQKSHGGGGKGYWKSGMGPETYQQEFVGVTGHNITLSLFAWCLEHQEIAPLPSNISIWLNNKMGERIKTCPNERKSSLVWIHCHYHWRSMT